MRFSWISILVTLFIVYLAVTRLEIETIGHTLQGVDLVFIGWALGVWVILVLGKILKWGKAVRSVGGAISFSTSAKTLLIGLFIGVITPGRIGDFVRVLYIKDKLGVGRSVMAVLVDRIIDISILFLFAFLGVWSLFSTNGQEVVSIPLLLFLGLIFVTGIFLVFNRRVGGNLWKVFNRFIPSSFREMITLHGREFYDNVPLLKKKAMVVVQVFLLGIGAWLMTVTMGFFLLQAAHINVGWGAALIAVPIISLVEILPFGVAGVGTREVGAIIVLSAYGVSPESAIVFSILYFIVGYIPSFVMGGLLFNREPPRIRESVEKLMKRAPKQNAAQK